MEAILAGHNLVTGVSSVVELLAGVDLLSPDLIPVFAHFALGCVLASAMPGMANSNISPYTQNTFYN